MICGVRDPSEYVNVAYSVFSKANNYVILHIDNKCVCEIA